MAKIDFTCEEVIIINPLLINRKAVEKLKWQNWCCFPRKEKEIILNKDFVDWKVISLYQELSKEFIIEFADKIDFSNIVRNKNISKEVKDYCRMFI